MNKRLSPFQGWRLTVFQAIIVAVFAVFSIRMYELQVIRYESFQIAAEDNRLNQLPLPARRGVIFDRYDNRLAFNVPAYNLTIVPAGLPDSQTEVLAIYNRLSALVDIPPTREIALASGRNIRSIEELVEEGRGIAPFRAVIVAQDIPYHAALQILEESYQMPGVTIEDVGVREYPTGALTSHIVGYMGPIPAEEAEELREQGYNPAFDRIGYEGIERYLEETLAGQRGFILREVDVAGEEGDRLARQEPVPGQNVRLTIDTELQAAAEQALVDQIAQVNAEQQDIVTQSGVVIAMDPRTGEILAMVSWPTFDNSRFARAIDGPYYLQLESDPQRPLFNNAIKAQYPPGSVWKLLTAAGVLEENVIDPRTELYDGGDLIIQNRYAPFDPAAAQRFVCWLPEGHGNVNLIEGIAWSCDVYFYQIGGGNDNISTQTLRTGGLGIEDLFRYATAMGVGSELGVELPFESAGRMPDPDWKRRNYGQSWSTGDTYNASFGQGYVNTSPLQLINSVAAIVNGGILYQPTIIRDFLDESGNVVQPFEPKILRNLTLDGISPDQPLKLLMLEDMIMKGSSSLACICEPTSPYYDELRCDPEGYRNQVNISPDSFEPQWREYEVHVPLNYTFNGNICQPIRFDPNYQPAFVSQANLRIINDGMRAAATIEGGTAIPAQTNLPNVEIGGKTGTAEYCDDIAFPLGLCVQGAWPSHAWFVAHAPYENPEIIILAFVYNGGEGSRVALPIVTKTMDAYFRLKSERATEQLSTGSAS